MPQYTWSSTTVSLVKPLKDSCQLYTRLCSSKAPTWSGTSPPDNSGLRSCWSGTPRKLLPAANSAITRPSYQPLYTGYLISLTTMKSWWYSGITPGELRYAVSLNVIPMKQDTGCQKHSAFSSVLQRCLGGPGSRTKFIPYKSSVSMDVCS